MESDQMKAVVITGPGNPDVLKVENRPIPVASANEVLIKVFAAGVNRPDVLQRKGHYPPPPGASTDIPGLEVAGIIESLGTQVTGLEVGQQVCALLTGGGYAEYAVAHSGQCLPIPQGLNFVEAASLPETIFTVWHNVFQRGSLKNHEHFLVHGGSSGIGITSIQLAKAFGAKAYATAGSDEKCDVCVSLGATKCINYNRFDFGKELAQEGIDVILDMVGGDYIAKNIRLLNEDGRLVFINTMKGSKLGADETIDFSYIMKKRLTVTGSTLRNRSTSFKGALKEEILKNVWPVIEEKLFKPIIFATFPMSEASKAHTLMESSNHIGKIILTNEW